MTTSEDALFAVPDAPHSQWRLAEVQLANWGTFDGAIYRLPVARRGHLVTGPSGSGKSSLLDAIAAVLTPDKWLRLNQAAQGAGARQDQRSVYSYVRGAWSRTIDATEDRVVSAYLRPKATWSGIVLRFEDGDGGVVSLCRLFFARATATASSDVNDLCLLDRSAVDLRDLQEFAAEGLETRRVQKAWPDALVTSNHSHGRFYARMRSIFGIADETALQLLHKTQSAKSLDSLDQLFRDYMLERPATFDLAQNAVDQFGELRDAHDRVVQLREQRDHLIGLKDHAERYDAAQTRAGAALALIEAVGPFQRRRGLELARGELEAVQERMSRLTIEADQAEEAYAAADDAVARSERLELQLGGAETGHLQQRIRAAEESARDVDARWKRFATELRRAGVDRAPTRVEEFAELVRGIDEILADAPPAVSVDHDRLAALARARDRVSSVEAAVSSIRTTGSTVPEELLRIRATLADELAVPVSALPFAAELIEVRPEHAAWTGAIERVLRPFALALLVRSEHLGSVRRWIDTHRLPGRLVFEEVADDAPAARPAGSDRSLVHRVTVSAGPFANWMNGQLSARYDVACVDSPDELDDHVRAVTINGQVKTSRTRYEKDDRRRIEDRSQWVLGDREAKLEALVEQLREATEEHRRIEEVVQRIEAEHQAAVQRRTILESARQQSWSDIDRQGAAQAVVDLEDQLRALTSDNASLHAAVQAAHTARDRRKKAHEALINSQSALKSTRTEDAELREVIASIEAELASGAIAEVEPGLAEELARRFRTRRRNLTRQVIGEVGQQVTQQLGQERDRALAEAQSATGALIGSATTFNDTWPAAAATAELVATVDDRRGYLELLDTIVAQGLPEYEANFLRLLRERSRDLIGELVSDILAAPREIQDRVTPVNASLRRSPFDEGRFLRLRVKTRRTETVNRFIADLRSVAEGSWSDDDLGSAERRFATLDSLMRRLASSEHADRTWRHQCLDTRQHVTFLAEEIDEHERVQATYDSGAAMSGGQQQKLVIFCLAAALRYQLADTEDAFPRYGTIVLDEAFDKADTRYTRMALDVFVEFGFQMVLATPQKLLQTIEPYVGAATSIENPTRQRSVVADVVWSDE
ncbi:ATP-binding protein [Nocardioides sambongensis]|uniref:ATP-binding protein n=1 Tax=Nocardioides sambongensis TaxID=2589074 RepID=UPI00112A5E9D|nr:SbcC/MukB-like Walker B domain-containing protein [Nocardioides sambongensis]